MFIKGNSRNCRKKEEKYKKSPMFFNSLLPRERSSQGKCCWRIWGTLITGGGEGQYCYALYSIETLEVIRATFFFNLQRNDVALQVEEKRCPYYRAFTVIYLSVCKYVIKRCPNKVVTQLTTNMAADGFHFSGLHTTDSSTQSLSNTLKSPSEQTHRLCPPCCQRSTMLIRL